MTQTETRIFHYDLRGHLIAETNQTGQMLAEYVYLGDQLLSMIKPGESVYYFHNDHLGTPQVLTDDSQAIAWKAVYTPFGEAVPSIQTVENPFRFPGQYYDQETGLHYNYFRYYNPQTGRYVTPDPIGLEGGINLFAYVAGNPLRWVDPLGLWFDGLSPINLPVWNPQAAARYLTNPASGWATTTSQGRCARAVRLAINTGGVATPNNPVAALGYLNYLPGIGFSSMDLRGYIPQVGDIAVFPAIPGNPYGHIQMYVGNRWQSDYIQPGRPIDGFYGPGFFANRRWASGPFTVFRRRD